MTEPIIWSTKKVKIGDLKDYEYNPRRMSKKDFERLVNDIKQDGYRNRIIVNSDLTILGGHSRKRALLEAGYAQSDEIDVLYPSRELADEELKRINIRDNLSFGEFDFDILANHFDPIELVEWGLPPEWILAPEIDNPKLEEKEDSDIYEICPECGSKLKGIESPTK